MRSRILRVFVGILLIFLITDLVSTKDFYYKHYSFRKKSRHARKYNVMEQECEAQTCGGLGGLDHVKCTRKCLSPVCYNEMYAWDELEEGEIDVRQSSFKGCVVNELQDKEEF